MENNIIPTKKSAAHFHIDEVTFENLRLIREAILPKDIPFRDVDIIRAAIHFLGNEIALRSPEQVQVKIYNVKHGSPDGNRILVLNKINQPTNIAPPVKVPPIKVASEELIAPDIDWDTPVESKPSV